MVGRAGLAPRQLAPGASVARVARSPGNWSSRHSPTAGVPLAAGETVSVVIASANRDERHYVDPDRYDLDRRADDHLSFGFGKHFCLGYHLAKLEANTVLTALLDRLPTLRLDPAAEPPRITGLAFRSPPALPVRFDA